MQEAKFLWRYPQEKPPFDDDKLFVIVVKRDDDPLRDYQVGAWAVQCPECDIGWHWENGDDYYRPERLKAWAEVPEFEGFQE